MTDSRQHRFALLVSIGLTALLVGVLVGFWGTWQAAKARWEDAEQLEQQLERVTSQNDSAPSGPEPALIRISLAERKVVQPENPIIGRLVEVRRVTVASEVTGKIMEMPVEIGAPVIGGQTVLARVDDIWPQLAVQRMQAQVASIDAHLSYLTVELQRSELLSERAATTESELEARRSAVAETQARLAEAHAALEEESERISRSVILAPFDGTVVEKQAELGGHLSPGAPIVDIVSRGQIDARLMVPETVINEVFLDQPLTVVIDPLGEQVQGTVVSVTPYGPTASRTFPVRVRMDDQDGRLKVGMSVTARITMGPPREALVVSSDAVLIRPDEATVWVALTDAESESLVEPVPVTITARMRDEFAVEPETERGRLILVEGAQVVIEGAERLTPGQPVRIMDETVS